MNFFVSMVARWGYIVYILLRLSWERINNLERTVANGCIIGKLEESPMNLVVDNVDAILKKEME